MYCMYQERTSMGGYSEPYIAYTRNRDEPNPFGTIIVLSERLLLSRVALVAHVLVQGRASTGGAGYCFGRFGHHVAFFVRHFLRVPDDYKQRTNIFVGCTLPRCVQKKVFKKSSKSGLGELCRAEVQDTQYKILRICLYICMYPFKVSRGHACQGMVPLARE